MSERGKKRLQRTGCVVSLLFFWNFQSWHVKQALVAVDNGGCSWGDGEGGDIHCGTGGLVFIMQPRLRNVNCKNLRTVAK